MSSTTSAPTVTVLTLNVWGLLVISAQRSARLAEIGRHIAHELRPTPDIVALQECFVRTDFDAIHAATSAVLPHARYFAGGAFGTGLAILSRWPIEDSWLFEYPLCGRPSAVTHGDWFVGKGVARIRVWMPFMGAKTGSEKLVEQQQHNENSLVDDGQWLEIFNTHTHAPYPTDDYALHRIAQSWVLAKMLHDATLLSLPSGGSNLTQRNKLSSRSTYTVDSHQLAAAATATEPSGTLREHTNCKLRFHRPLVIALGDFNMKPCSIQHKVLTARAPAMRDTWRVMHPDSSLGCVTDLPERMRNRPVPTVAFNLEENGCTSNNATNTWRWDGKRRRRLNKLAAAAAASTETGHEAGGVVMPVSDATPDPNGHRLDYVFANVWGAENAGSWEVDDGDLTLAHTNVQSRKQLDDVEPVWLIREARVVMTERHPTLQCSLSDHYGYLVTFARRTLQTAPVLQGDSETPQTFEINNPQFDAGHPQNKLPPSNGVSGSSCLASLTEPQCQASLEFDGPGAHQSSKSNPKASVTNDNSVRIENRLKDTARRPLDDNDPLMQPHYEEILTMLRSFAAARKREQKNRYSHFVLSCIVISPALLVASWFVPRYGSFTILLFGMLNFAAGFLDGLYALLFLGRERRCLDQFEWEIVNAMTFSLMA